MSRFGVCAIYRPVAATPPSLPPRPLPQPVPPPPAPHRPAASLFLVPEATIWLIRHRDINNTKRKPASLRAAGYGLQLQQRCHKKENSTRTELTERKLPTSPTPTSLSRLLCSDNSSCDVVDARCPFFSFSFFSSFSSVNRLLAYFSCSLVVVSMSRSYLRSVEYVQPLMCASR